MLSAAEYHNKFHLNKHGNPYAKETCRRCAVAGAKCASKQVYKSRAEVDKAALTINIERRWFPGSCMLPYNCRHCRLWHLTSACRTWQNRRVEKMRQRWLRKTGLRDCLENGGWAAYEERQRALPEAG